MRLTILPKLRSHLLIIISSTCCAMLPVAASPLQTAAQTKGQPPIIDRELFFGDPEISGASLSPDGKFIAFIKLFRGTRNIWVGRDVYRSGRSRLFITPLGAECV